MVSVSRRLVGHFKHSTMAINELTSIQEERNLPQHTLIQDVATRWNSTYYMLERLLEQKAAVAVYASNHANVTALNANQWKLAENVVKILKPFEKATKECSKDKECVSMIIPRVKMLLMKLDNLSEEVSGVGTTIDTLKESLTTRFAEAEDNKHAVLATVLDPRYRVAFFRDARTKDKVEEWITEADREIHEVDDAEAIADHPQEAGEAAQPAADQDDDDEYLAILQDSTGDMEVGDVSSMSAIQEYAMYLKERQPPQSSDPLDWWKAQQVQSKYPRLRKIVKRFLSPPAASVPSERLFSEASEVYDAKRRSMNPDKAEMLLVIRGNLPLLKFKYL